MQRKQPSRWHRTGQCGSGSPSRGCPRHRAVWSTTFRVQSIPPALTGQRCHCGLMEALPAWELGADSRNMLGDLPRTSKRARGSAATPAVRHHASTLRARSRTALRSLSTSSCDRSFRAKASSQLVAEVVTCRVRPPKYGECDGVQQRGLFSRYVPQCSFGCISCLRAERLRST